MAKKHKKKIRRAKRPAKHIRRRRVRQQKLRMKFVGRPKAKHEVRAEVSWPSEIAARLLRKGRLRSFLTEAEVLQALPELEEYLVEFDHFLDDLDRAGVQIVEGARDFFGGPF